jgi:hypothetical protein
MAHPKERKIKNEVKGFLQSFPSILSTSKSSSYLTDYKLEVEGIDGISYGAKLYCSSFGSDATLVIYLEHTPTGYTRSVSFDSNLRKSKFLSDSNKQKLKNLFDEFITKSHLAIEKEKTREEKKDSLQTRQIVTKEIVQHFKDISETRIQPSSIAQGFQFISKESYIKVLAVAYEIEFEDMESLYLNYEALTRVT